MTLVLDAERVARQREAGRPVTSWILLSLLARDREIVSASHPPRIGAASKTSCESSPASVSWSWRK